MKSNMPFIILAILGLGAVGIFSISFWLFLQDSHNASELAIANPPAIQSPTATEEAEEPARPSFSILMMGDVMLGRYVETLIASKGINYIFQGVQAELTSTDLVVGNLEGPIVSDTPKTLDNSLRFSFNPDIAEMLSKQHFSAVTLANNHTLDFGTAGFEETCATLSQHNIASFGHPRNTSEADAWIVSKPYAIRFLGFSTLQNFSLEDATQTISKNASSFELTVAFMHWGAEYAGSSNKEQQRIAHALVDAGAHIVIGHHPHVVQEIETYEDGIIFYSLGNAVFDQYFSDETQEELFVKLTIDENDLSLKLIPVASEKTSLSIMQDNEANGWLESLAKKSDPDIATSIKSGSILMPLPAT